MSNERHETIDDIVKEIRGNAEHNHALVEVSKYLTEISDRIEAAAKREREAGAKAAQICGEIVEMVGREAACHQSVTDCNGVNAAAMREALENIANMGEQIDYQLGSSDETVYAFRHECSLAHSISECARTALSAPPRNCDLLSDAQEALAAIHEDRCYVNNPIDERRLTVEWLFAKANGESK